MHHGSHFGSFGHRRFISKEEVIAHLEEYLKQLKAEATGVEEHIAELKKECS
jgi:cell division protein FtsB